MAKTTSPAIATLQLPQRCPACARPHPACEALDAPRRFRVSCGCGWAERYEIRDSIERVQTSARRGR
jgi:hypothetical protein